MSFSIRSPCQNSDNQALKFSSGIPRRLCLRADLHLWIFFFSGPDYGVDYLENGCAYMKDFPINPQAFCPVTHPSLRSPF